MELLQLSYWLYLAQFWVAIGLLFVILEVTDGSAIFFLPLGLAGLILGLLIYLVEIALIPANLIPDKWYWIMVFWHSLCWWNLICHILNLHHFIYLIML